MSQPLTERYDERIAGILSCYDRVVITGTLPGVCYAGGMTRFLQANRVRIFDYPQFAATLRDRVRERAASLAFSAAIPKLGQATVPDAPERTPDFADPLIEHPGCAEPSLAAA